MTNEKEVLELAKKCGAQQSTVVYGNSTRPGGLVFEDSSAALEEKHQAQIAMLRDALTISTKYAVLNTSPVNNDGLGCSQEFIEKLRKQSDEALSATHKSSVAFLAEVRAKALEDAASKHSAGYVSKERLLRMAAELRASAAQPEGKEQP